MEERLKADVDAVREIAAVPSILEVIAETTGMGFVAVARVTGTEWVACEVVDRVHFGLKPGDELPLETTICNDVRALRTEVVIDHVAEDPVFAHHHTPAMYGFQSYVSVPIIQANGELFGTLCAIDAQPRTLKGTAAERMFRLFAELIAFHLDGQRDITTSRGDLRLSQAALAESRDQLATSRADLTSSEKNLVSSRASLARSEADLASSEASLADRREELAEMTSTGELREQFIAVLGHDLRNPLASISSGVQLLSKDETDARNIRILRVMAEGVGRMGLLIDNLLDFARGRLGGGIGLDMSNDARIEPLLSRIVSEIRTAYPERTIEVSFELDRPIDVDPGRVGQLLSNLLGNAITHGAASEPIIVTAKLVDNRFELAVANGGEAIPATTITHLFKPFQRGAVRADQQGLGLGLFIASEIAKAHGGEIVVASNDRQTRFTFQMPVARSV